jgi:hypothetical protein
LLRIATLRVAVPRHAPLFDYPAMKNRTVNVVEDEMIAAIDARSGVREREAEEAKLVAAFVAAQARARSSERSEHPRRRRIVG